MTTTISTRARLPKLHLATVAGLGLIVLLLVVNYLVSQANSQRQVENESRVLHQQEVLTTLEATLAR
ncbi:MAG: hypothetical protein JNG90_19150, partial [Planctomycetaceae bacterium]|nr:hypothetical protein [Planctomycetaceae bacterium]